MLNELVEYARKNLDSEPGFTTRTVRWLADISSDGQLINVLPLGNDKGEQTPKCPEMHNMNAGGRAHFLVETLQTVTLYFKPNEDEKKIAGSREKQLFFAEMLHQAATTTVKLQPLGHFLKNSEQIELLRTRLAADKAKPTDWLRWRIAGADPLQETSVLDWWRTWREADQRKGKGEVKPKRGEKAVEKLLESVPGGMVCFLSGEELQPLSTQPKITGLSGVGGLGTGDVMVGFDKSAFCSFGLEQANNAAMGEKSARKYVDALNHLIKNHSHKLANALVVHWFKEAIQKEDDPLSFLSEPPELTAGAAQQSAREILAAIRKGKYPVPANNRFYAMTVSGASGRVMVRDWMEGSFEELVARIELWFSNLEIVAREGGKSASEPKFMAVCGSIVRDLKDLPAPTATTLWRVAIAGLPIPQSIMTQALARFRADLIEDKPFNHARMGLIKAYFIRKGGEHQMSAYLNKEHSEPAYQCGRLLAVLAGLQRAALGDVGAGVVQRYYVAASQTPGLTLGRLFNNAKNHLNKLDGGLAYWFEDQIAEIMSRLQDRIPSTLNLDQQSLFALGYYQQIAANRAGKNNDTKETKGDNQ
ncbi:MAG TPA: type I-C CRISPR-associated protein Cas8c/Csd1 [Dissulfurispiraceae bacterium]|nr:type I-C CRISPR-associated protein Cas8c/Csd1 [Dissulfurispiraceae bacterium]